MMEVKHKSDSHNLEYLDKSVLLIVNQISSIPMFFYTNYDLPNINKTGSLVYLILLLH